VRNLVIEFVATFAHGSPHKDQAGARKNSQSPMVAKGGTVMDSDYLKYPVPDSAGFEVPHHVKSTEQCGSSLIGDIGDFGIVKH
jgi:hypothetical protein